MENIEKYVIIISGRQTGVDMKSAKKILLWVFLSLFLVGGGVGSIVYFAIDTQRYTVTFSAEGHEQDGKTVCVRENGTIKLPELTKEGYDFLGWYSGDVLWTCETQVKEDTQLVAKFEIKKFNITFVVDGISYTTEHEYNSMPEYGEVPQKESSQLTEYIFTGWTPALEPVKGDAVYTAQFEGERYRYIVDMSSNYSSAFTATGTGAHDKETDVEVSINVNDGYILNGVYLNSSIYSTSPSFTIENISQDYNFILDFGLDEKNINYHDNSGVENNNPTTYTINSETITFSNLERQGYRFLGWFTEENGGTKISSIDSTELQDYDLYAHWELIKYRITYNLNNEVTISNPEEYDIETQTFTLNNPSSDSATFLGWEGTGISEITQTVTIVKGSVGDRTYTARWQYIYATLSFEVNGVPLSEYSMTAKVDSEITAPTIDTSLYGMTGYSIDGWYTDSDCNNRFTFSTMPAENKTVYGRWGDYVNSYGFYPYISKFDNEILNPNQVMTISDENELLAWIEYVQFYDITDKIYFNADAVYGTLNNNNWSDVLNEYVKKSLYPNGAKLSIGAKMSGSIVVSCCIYVSGSYRSYELGTSQFIDADPTRAGTKQQVEYALAMDYEPVTRESGYSAHKINNVPMALAVETSNQLLYALEHGLKPILKADSPAENVYNSAVLILNNIIDDNMTDVEKCRAIYEWIVLNVSYDHAALDITDESNDWQTVDAWYAEGVFNHKKAVCDGISKAFLIMAKIENIPTLRVVSQTHAWNKVFINGNWYGIDATHGDKSIDNNEAISYENFMFTDAWKSDSNGGGQIATNYTDSKFAATNVYNIFETIQGSYNKNEFDLYIDDYTNNLNNELKYLLASTKNFAYSGEQYIVVIAWAVTGVNLANNIYGIAINAGVICDGYTHHTTSIDGVEEYVIFLYHSSFQLKN